MSLPENRRVARPPTPPFWRWLMRITGAFSLMLFLTPTVYVIKYYAADHPREAARAALISTTRLEPTVQKRYQEAIEAKHALLAADTPDNLLLQSKVAEHDADPMWRRDAVWAIGATLAVPGVNWRRPLEAVSAKATLAQVATHDADPAVRAAAAETLAQVAQRGAVIRR